MAVISNTILFVQEMTTELEHLMEFEMTADILCKQEGWVRIKHSHPNLEEVMQWLKQNCQDQYISGWREVIFKSDKDYVMFLLRWT
jgi:hypothetical protein